jgi:hypothetical protein
MSVRSLKFAAILLVAAARFSIADEPADKATQSRTGHSAGAVNESQAPNGHSPRAAAKKPAAAKAPPRVLFISMQGCSACERELARLRRPGGDFDAMRARGWKIGGTADNHLQIVDWEEIPELVEKLNIHEFPTVVCVADGEIIRSFKHGCTTPLDAWTFGFLLNGKNERPAAAIPEKALVETTGSYPLRGNHWSVDGDWEPTKAVLISHLRGPNHADQLSPEWAIDSWSYEELRSLHDDLHERELANDAGVSNAGYFESQPAPSQSSQFSANRKITGR